MYNYSNWKKNNLLKEVRKEINKFFSWSTTIKEEVMVKQWDKRNQKETFHLEFFVPKVFTSNKIYTQAFYIIDTQFLRNKERYNRLV